MGHHLSYGITQRYLPYDTGECVTPNPSQKDRFDLPTPAGIEG